MKHLNSFLLAGALALASSAAFAAEPGSTIQGVDGAAPAQYLSQDGLNSYAYEQGTVARSRTTVRAPATSAYGMEAPTTGYGAGVIMGPGY